MADPSHKMDPGPIITAFLPLALSSQDAPLSQERSTEEGEVAALRLTARSQVSGSPSRLLKTPPDCSECTRTPLFLGWAFVVRQSSSRELGSSSKRLLGYLMHSVENVFYLPPVPSPSSIYCHSTGIGGALSFLDCLCSFCAW